MLQFNSQEVGQIVRVIEGIYRGLHPDFPEHFTQQLIVNVDQKMYYQLSPFVFILFFSGPSLTQHTHTQPHRPCSTRSRAHRRYASMFPRYHVINMFLIHLYVSDIVFLNNNAGRAGSFDNFWHIFCAWCNYYGIRDVKSSPETKDAAASIQFLPEFQRYLQKKFADKSHVLDNPPLQNAIHFKVRARHHYLPSHQSIDLTVRTRTRTRTRTQPKCDTL
jgi:hypothetical protein